MGKSLSTRQFKDIYGGHAASAPPVVLDFANAKANDPAEDAKARDIERRRMQKYLNDKIAEGRGVDIVTLTPVLAELFLERNPHNRPLATTNLDSLQRDTAAGRFAFTNATIGVFEDGTLADGQHRCETVIRTGIPIETVIVFGIPLSSMPAIDIGKSRTTANLLAINEGVNKKVATVVSTVAGMIWKWKKHNRMARGAMELPTKVEVIETYKAVDGIEESVAFCSRRRAGLVAPPAVLAFCHWAFKKRAGEVAADAFMLRLIDGDRRRDGDPVLYCRDRLIDLKKWVFPQVRVSLIFQAWNAWRRNEKLYRLHANDRSLPELEG